METIIRDAARLLVRFDWLGDGEAFLYREGFDFDAWVACYSALSSDGNAFALEMIIGHTTEAGAIAAAPDCVKRLKQLVDAEIAEYNARQRSEYSGP